MSQNEFQEYPFPKYINRPRLIGIFEADEFFLSFILMAAIVALSLLFPNVQSLYVMIGAVTSGLGSAALYHKFKKNMPDGYTKQKLYRMGIYAPTDDKKAYVSYPYLKKLSRVIPYGFTKVFYN